MFLATDVFRLPWVGKVLGSLVAAASNQQGEIHMADKYRPVTRDELDELAGEALPERAAMSLINANVAVPVNAAVAANVLTDHSTSTATSAPNGAITQQPDLRS
jgi:hypothetical protein